MNKINEKRTILSVIALLSLIALFLSLFFAIMKVSIHSYSASSFISDNGFDLLSLRFHGLAGFFKTFVKGSFNRPYHEYEEILGVMCTIIHGYALDLFIITIIVIIAGRGTRRTGFFTFIVIVSFIISVVYTVMAIDFISVVKEDFSNNIGKAGFVTEAEKFTLNSIKTELYWGTIIQAFLLTGYIVASVLLKEKPKLQEEKEISHEKVLCNDYKDNAQALEYTVNSLTNQLKQYWQMLNDGEIISLEYQEKKNQIIKFLKITTKNTFGNMVNELTINETIENEEKIIKIIGQYKALLDEKIISDDEYVLLKADLIRK